MVEEDGSTTLVEAPEARGLVWKQGNHEFLRTQDGAECVRCNLTCAPVRVASANRSRCPTWVLLVSEGNENIEARQWANWAVRLPTTWRHANGGAEGRHQ
eukprot:1806077-Heterocapsa_arctica.AAC.1